MILCRRKETVKLFYYYFCSRVKSEMKLWLQSTFYITILLNHVKCYSDPWVWVCNTKRSACQRSLKINVAQDRELFTSLEICRLLCGKHGGLWPKPSVFTKLGKELVQIYPRNIKFSNPKLPEETNILLKEIQNVFLRKPSLKCSKCGYTENTVKIQLNFDNTETELLSTTDESYKLRVVTQTPQIYINISATNVFGIRHGLETLSQTIATNSTLNEDGNITMWMISNLFISDKPKFRHRGLLIDTARHYLKISTIKKQIDGLGMSKMNVLHWHATDTHSFPIVLPSVPQLAQYGAYSPQKVYTLNDIEDVIRYAKIRGVRVILEIDAPSHAGNGWQFGPLHDLGELAVCINYSPFQHYCLQPPCGQVNPANQNLYRILEKIFEDIGKIYAKDEYFHMGGDEISMSCWNTSKEISNYMKKSNMSDDTLGFLTLWADYQNKALNAHDKGMKNGNRTVIVWSSALTTPKVIRKFLDKDRYIIQTWVARGSTLPRRLLRKGYQIIMSPKNAWYLDHGVRQDTKYSTWRRIYAQKMPKHKNVLGGEVCMWGEFVSDVNIDTKVWPRAAAAAERLWTNSKRNRSRRVENRFYQHRERLIASKIGAEPVTPEWCVYNEGEC